MAVVHSHNCVESSCFPLSCRGKFAGGKMEKIGVTCRGDYYLSEYKWPVPRELNTSTCLQVIFLCFVQSIQIMLTLHVCLVHKSRDSALIPNPRQSLSAQP